MKEPEWIGDFGREKWREIRKRLGEIGDDIADAVALYCEAYNRYRRALLTIEAEGETCTSEKGGSYQHPAVGIANKASDTMRQLGPAIGWREGKSVKPAAKGVATRQRR